MKKYYLAYGSNLNLSQMKKRCPRSKKVGSTTLEGYRLVFRGGDDTYSYLTIEPDPESSVPVGIFELSFIDTFLLDRYEGYPELYSKKYIPINIDGKTKKALIYVMNEKFDYHLPSIHYYNTCLRGYYDFNFDFEKLREAIQYTKNHMDKQKVKIKLKDE